MLQVALLTAVLVALCAAVHYEALRACNDRFPALGVPARAKVLLAIAVAFLSHLAQIALFAGAYGLLDGTALGRLHGQFDGSVASFLYFSAETYTSLGLGDVFPLGEMRLLAGIEALVGLLMISWSASFTYLEMRRDWQAPER